MYFLICHPIGLGVEKVIEVLISERQFIDFTLIYKEMHGFYKVLYLDEEQNTFHKHLHA